jgi:hypothetical protein
MKKYIFFLLAAAVLMGAGCGVPGAVGPESAGKSAGKLVSFQDFWSGLQADAASWSGGDYYIIDVFNNAVTSNINRLDSRNGEAISWQGSYVKCETIKAAGGFDENKTPICRGKKRFFTMYIDSHGEKKTTTEDDTFAFYGQEYFKADLVKVTPAEAQKKAEADKGYTATGNEDYSMKLALNGKVGAPVWTVGKSCSYEAVRQDKCAPSDHWSVKINAITGEVIK